MKRCKHASRALLPLMLGAAAGTRPVDCCVVGLVGGVLLSDGLFDQVDHGGHSHCVSGCAGNGSGVLLFGTGNYVFPQVTAYGAPKTKRTAAWIARYSTHEDIIASLAMVPAVIDHQGLWCAARSLLAGAKAQVLR